MRYTGRRTLNGRKIEAMHRFYGTDPGRGICADCQHLVRIVRDRTYYKCSLYGVSDSEATDWRKHWQACALIDHDPEPDNFEPVMQRLQHEERRYKHRINGELPGQMEVEDFLHETTDQEG